MNNSDNNLDAGSDTSLDISSDKDSMAKKWLYIFESGPYSSMAGQEALDAAMIGATFEQEISVLFLHDGVFQLKRDQSTDLTPIKQYTKTFNALADFDINQVYVHDLSLLARGLNENDLMIQVQQVCATSITQLIAQQDNVFTF